MALTEVTMEEVINKNHSMIKEVIEVVEVEVVEEDAAEEEDMATKKGKRFNPITITITPVKVNIIILTIN